QGNSTVTAYIRLNYDPSQALTDVMAKVQQVKYLMPAQAQDPIILKATGQTTAVMYIGFASAELQSAAISDYLTRVVQPLLSTVAGVRALLPEIQRNLPPSVKMQVAYDSTRFIQASIDEVKFSLAQAVVIVVVVIFLFLGSFRAVLIPVVTIPLSLIGAGIVM